MRMSMCSSLAGVCTEPPRPGAVGTSACLKDTTTPKELVGASVAGGGASGAPSVSLKTTEEGSLVFAVGNDWDKAVGRTLGPNQVMLNQDISTKTGDTYWSQYTGQITGPLGETVTMNDTAPTNDQWNMAAVEVLGDGPGA
jgi:hypothetical protein